MLAILVPRQSRSEGVPQESEPLVDIAAPPVAILAVHDARLRGMQFQPATRQPLGNGRSHQARLRFADAVHDHIIAVAFKAQIWETLPHPAIERVMQK